jgi:hypothetical protein
MSDGGTSPTARSEKSAVRNIRDPAKPGTSVAFGVPVRSLARSGVLTILPSYRFGPWPADHHVHLGQRVIAHVRRVRALGRVVRPLCVHKACGMAATWLGQSAVRTVTSRISRIKYIQS